MVAVAGITSAWCGALTELLDDEANEEWTEGLLERLKDAWSRLRLFLEVRISPFCFPECLRLFSESPDLVARQMGATMLREVASILDAVFRGRPATNSQCRSPRMRPHRPSGPPSGAGSS